MSTTGGGSELVRGRRTVDRGGAGRNDGVSYVTSNLLSSTSSSKSPFEETLRKREEQPRSAVVEMLELYRVRSYILFRKDATQRPKARKSSNSPMDCPQRERDVVRRRE